MMIDSGKQEHIEDVLSGLPSDWRLRARQVIEEFPTGLSDLEWALESAGSLEAALEVVKTYQYALGCETD